MSRALEFSIAGFVLGALTVHALFAEADNVYVANFGPLLAFPAGLVGSLMGAAVGASVHEREGQSDSSVRRPPCSGNRKGPLEGTAFGDLMGISAVFVCFFRRGIQSAARRFESFRARM